MAKIDRFEDIEAWKKAKLLNKQVYQLFGDINNYSFKDQIQRATTSIMNNIAEGFERQTNKEFKQFLYIAKGSAAETRSMLYLAHELDYLNEKEAKELVKSCYEISRMLSGFIKKL